MRLRFLALLATLAPFAFADVEFTGPAAGDTITVGVQAASITVKWKESGDAPPITDLLSYDLFLCAGGNAEGEWIPLANLISKGVYTTGNQALATISIGVGADTKNAYFLQMISVMKTGGRVTNYSNRFTLKGVTGVFPAAVITGLKSVTTTDGPATQKDTAEALPAPAEAGDFGVPYLEQTGIMKFAPMQKLPPTKISKKDMKPLFPSTSFQIARTWLPTPKQKTTTTQSRTYKFSSMENTVAAAAQPTDDMERFLARWKD
ncbi:hypothetical protein W97_05305 [Coniosporium apollinis CBS 100218]|uniref:Uncharacterized protein n=1 Tax=Coniosporium apollinis (strain CBS 100218) TaxID=1168221 RepID=R7YVZ2_CONA1|nr:uncharacterized protein W97_05305 [Coniosporium apollinis CBS 100218]EON66062.1 hypothetical protein W97_05305 [Coniosporium apollinis CBS 100218]